MKLGSLFDGSGGFPLAGVLCGLEPIWASEIEPYPIAVTRSRFPYMKHLGDISKINGADIEPVDIITFGSPCQDLSVAGKRAGLKHENNGDDETTRSGLFMEAVRIIKEMREKTNGKYPRYAVWENVPGAFSSNKGEDFRIVLEEIIKITEASAVMPEVPQFGWPYADSYCGDGWSVAYRVFDAQYWGVPQRRRRIYLVADFGGQRAREILFEREGLRGYFAEGGTPWKNTSNDTERSVGADNTEGSIPYTLKIRSGVSVDSYGKAAGKGALIQKNLSATLGVSQDQYLFQPMAYGICSYESNSMKSSNAHSGVYEAKTSRTLDLNAGNPACNQGGVAIVEEMVLDDQGGSQITVRKDGKAPTLRAEMHGNVPCVMESAGFCTEHSAKSRSIGFEEEVSPTLRAGVTPACVYSVENHPADSRVNLDDSGKVQTLTSRMGTGGGNVPMVMEPVVYNGENITHPLNKTNPKPGDPCHTLGTDNRNYLVGTIALEGNGQRPSHRGDGYLESDKSYTLNATEVHGVAYPVITASKASFFMNTDEERASTLVATDYKDPQMVCYAVDQGGGKSQANVTENLSPTLTCTHGGEPAIAIDRAFFNQGKNALYKPQTYEDGTVPTLVAKGPGAVATRYIVRRLTPTECARLQGFADRWGDVEPKTNFTDEEYRFWLEVRNTHATINGKAVKDYDKKQMLAWYKKLHTDSAEYKLWGNGIALPTALYVIQGIAESEKT